MELGDVKFWVVRWGLTFRHVVGWCRGPRVNSSYFTNAVLTYDVPDSWKGTVQASGTWSEDRALKPWTDVCGTK